MALASLLFADLVDSTSVVARLGDKQAAKLWVEHDRAARDLMRLYGATEIDRSDGFFLLFQAAADAARFAVSYHEIALALGVPARIGIHAGEVTLRANDRDDVEHGAKPLEVEGLAKPVAARVMGLARGNQTLLSRTAVDALGADIPEGCSLVCHAHYRLKGVDAPIEIFEIAPNAQPEVEPPRDTEKAYRVALVGNQWRPVRDVPNNLLAERDTFIGRVHELSHLSQRLESGVRLLTVLATGGTGKTRLVRHHAWNCLGDWTGGAYFCDLSEAQTQNGICFSVSSALGLQLTDEPILTIGRSIAGRGRCLIILDNFEQVVEHAPSTLGTWLDLAPTATFLVTSRERLRLQGEEVFRLEPLPIATDAVRLFEARATPIASEFMLEPENRSLVERIARLVDGLPLAIELAAARVNVLSPAQIVDRLAHRFHILYKANGPASRQATLRATIDWSWDLLSTLEQSALVQCSVFNDGFTLRSAEAVLDLSSFQGATPAMDVVQALVDKSLLQSRVPFRVNGQSIEPRFAMYASIRDYAKEKFNTAAVPSQGSVAQRHARHFAAFGSDESIEALHGPAGIRLRRSLTLELENLLAALHWAISEKDSQTAVLVYRAVIHVFSLTGPFEAAVAIGNRLESLDLTPALRTIFHLARGQALFDFGKTQESSHQYQAALDSARQLKDRRGEGTALRQLGHICRRHGKVEDARRHLRDALECHRDIGYRRGELLAHMFLSVLLRDSESLEAVEHLNAALRIALELGNRIDEGSVLAHLAISYVQLGRFAEAEAHYRHSLDICREAGDRIGEGNILGNLADALYGLGRREEAARCLEASLIIHRETGNRSNEAYTLCNLGASHLRAGDFETARAHLEAALAIAVAVDSRNCEVASLMNLGELHRSLGCLEEAASFFQESLSLAREIGNRRFEALALGEFGDVLSRQGETKDALLVLEVGVSLLRGLRNQEHLGHLLCLRGHAEYRDGSLERAKATLNEAVQLADELGLNADSELRLEAHALRTQISAPLTPRG